ncbi:MAG: sulfurtransferase TusA family protein [Candidatus Rokubacteria bacterium]|nr:sulfurtransferase TusA family protein [Candidatus Rokubacteria bacterium]
MASEAPGDESPVMVDNRGLLCAQGILRLMRALPPLPPGRLLRVLSTDPAAEHDYPAWCRNTGHVFLRHEREDGLIVSYIRKRAP